MPQRTRDWLRQGRAELDAAVTLLEGGHWAWCCFTSQQAAEKALKALCEHVRIPQFGHNLNHLAHALQAIVRVPAEVVDAAGRLNRYYIPTRYPDVFSEGAPTDQFFESDARTAVGDSQAILAWTTETIDAP